METFVDDFRKEGFSIGFEQGFAQGFEQGVEKGRRLSCLGSIHKFLDRRFDTVPQSLRDKTAAIEDYPALEEAFMFVSEAKSTDEIERFVDRLEPRR